MHIWRPVTIWLLSLFPTAVVLADVASGDPTRVWLVKDGKPVADVLAGTTEWGTAERLVRRIEKWTGAKLLLRGATHPASFRSDMGRLILGTAESHPEVAHRVGRSGAYQNLNDQGYLIKVMTDPPVMIVAGKTPPAVVYGVGELMHYRLEVEKGNVWCEPLELTEQPVLPYRWFWISNSYAHWDSQYGGPHITDEVHRLFGKHPDGTELTPTRYPAQSMGRDAFINTYKAMSDWMSEHKLNGAMIFGYLNYGVDAGRLVGHYGRIRGVDIIAGVGTMGYWGAYYGGYNDFNLDTLQKLRPEIQREMKSGAKTTCPSLPGNQQYWKEGGNWLAKALPEIGGLYLENGDLASCHCEQCRATRARESNDTGCYWDMMASSVPVIEGAAVTQPQWKYVYATYTSFLPGGWKTGTSRTPPRFPTQFPPSAICMWTVSGLNQDTWPEGATAPAPHNVALCHSPSIWGTPDGADRWWAGPGSSHDDVSRRARAYCNRIASGNFEGLILKGMKNHHSPGPMLSYIALGEFSFHPERTMEQWETERLSRLFGGVERAANYLRLARDSSRVPV